MSTIKAASKTCFTYRLRPPVGLERTLLKELRTILPQNSSARKIPGRKSIEVLGPEETLWHLMFKSRIAEDIQVRITQPFLARGEKELESNLQKVPWHCYLPDSSKHNDLQFKMPQTRAKTHMSKLYHTQMVRDILIEQITECQIRKDFKGQLSSSSNVISSFRAYKKEWISRKQAEEKREVERQAKESLKAKLGDAYEVKGSSAESTEAEIEEQKKIKTLNEVRAELRAQKDFVKNLKELSKIQININKDKAELLLGTSSEELHKHGYKPFVRWGVLKETLTAACILESGILQKANKTGKLYLWDPFCGSGSFLIETLMMLLEQPVRNFSNSEMPFQYWPIHQKEEYERFREELNDFHKMRRRHEIDVQIIGSDVSQKAIDTTIRNIEYADIQKLCEQDLIRANRHQFINDPMILSQHWPKAFTSLNLQDEESSLTSEQKNESQSAEITNSNQQSQLLNFGDTERHLIMSAYHGDFQEIGHKIAERTDGFKDFTIVTNIPYGLQSKVKQHQTDTDLHNLYRRIGRFLRLYPNLEHNTYILAQAHHYGHKLSFEKFSNCGWKKEITFENGGIGVHLLKYDMSQISEVKQTIDAYKELDKIESNTSYIKEDEEKQLE